LNNFYRDFPYASDSSLIFKTSRSGSAKVIRMLDHEGLIAFTTNGVYTSTGILTVDNLSLVKRGKWVIDANIPPLVVPGGVFFVDTAGAIRQLIYNDQLLGYESTEQTIFSNHIFAKRRITSWAFQDGVTPMIAVTFKDGTFAMFSYNFEHKITAWTRGDSVYPVEQVEDSGYNDFMFFVVNKDGQRYIEVSLPRRLSPEEIERNPQSKMMMSFAFMDSIFTYKDCLTDQYLGSEPDTFHITPVTPGDWSGQLSIATDGKFFNGLVMNDVIRWFNPEDDSYIDLTVNVVQVSGAAPILVTPSEEFPDEYADGPTLYLTKNVITGLDHLDDEEVSVMVDGYMVSSAYNDVEGYPVTTVTGGSLTLPSSLRGAIVHVGRPIVADIKTLPATTVEQGPTTIESLTTNKLYVKVADTRGLYISNKFPEEADGEVDGTSVDKMESLDEALEAVEDDPLIGNRYLEPITKRCERVIPGAWDNQGSVAIRQVDPLHFEIISVISDLEILSRSNRR
jgi:hypothetical protein